MNLPDLPHRPFLIGHRFEPLVSYHAANDDAFVSDSECVEDMAPGAAFVAFLGMWLAEHWPALAIGAIAGLLALAIPAIIVARQVAG